jgi:hypothetical protein
METGNGKNEHDSQQRHDHNQLQQRKTVPVCVVSRPWSVVESYLGFTIFVSHFEKVQI